MTDPWSLAAGVALGVLAGAYHLSVARVRARLLLSRGSALVMTLYPVGLVGPALAVLLAARIGFASAWAVPFGIWMVRTAVLRRAVRAS